MTDPYVSPNPSHTDPRPWAERVDHDGFVPGPASWAQHEPSDETPEEPGQPVGPGSFALLVLGWCAVWTTAAVLLAKMGGF